MKLGEVGEYVRGLTYNADDVQDTGTIVIRANNLNDGCPIDFKTELVHVSILPDPHQILRNADITICMANGSSHLVGKASYCCDTSLGTITVGAFCGIFRSTNDLARWIFQTPTYKRYIYKAIQGGNGAIANLKSDDILNQSYFLPSLPEQRKIAALLSLIDERIEVQNAIIKEQEALKASLIRRLFDRTLRFPEFTDEWKKVKLGEVGKMYNGLSGKKAADFGAGYPFITYKMVFDSGVIDMSKVSYVEIGPGEKQNKVREGDIFFTTSSETIDEVGMSSVLLKDADNLFLNSFCFGYRLNTPNLTTSQYLGYMLRGPQMRMRISSLGQGITRFNISKEKVADLQIAIPSLSEQRKIADLLSAVDERLAVERAYAEQLKLQKTYLLRQMFI